MNPEDKTIACADKSREFGAMGELLRALQEEELEQTESSSLEIPEASITQNTAELMAEINATLKEIAETQKMILEEIKTQAFSKKA
jgi:ribonuclease HI